MNPLTHHSLIVSLDMHRLKEHSPADDLYWSTLVNRYQAYPNVVCDAEHGGAPAPCELLGGPLCYLRG